MADVKSTQILAAPVDLADPQLNVVPDPGGPLKPGRYTFSLVVTDDVGQKSGTATFVVDVRDAPAVKIDGPTVVPFNQPIPLVARVSSTGPIKSFTWSVKVG